MDQNKAVQSTDDPSVIVDQLLRDNVIDKRSAKSSSFIDQMVACRSSTPIFGKAFCPRWVEGPMTHHRVENFRRLDDDTIPYGGAVGYRSLAKTVSMKLSLIRRACYKRIRFVVWASSVQELAEQETENIRQEIVSNPEIRAVFKNMKPKPYNGVNLTFSKASFYLCDPATDEPFCFFLPRGVGSTCNGLIINIAGKPYRPDQLVLDDGEDRKLVGNDDYRREVREWLFGTFLPCVSDVRPSGRKWVKDKDADLWTPPWRAWVSDTYKHNDCLAQHLMTDPAWDFGVYPKVEYSETEKKWLTTVPEIYTQEQADQEMADYEARGMLSRYMKEFGCRGTADLNRRFIRDYFEYYSDQARDVNHDGGIIKFAIIDPARSDQPWADYTAMLFVGWDTHGGDVLLRDEYADRVDTPDFLEALYAKCIKNNTRELWLETTGNEGLPYTIKQFFMRKKKPIRVNTMTAKTIPGDWGDGDDARKIALGAQVLPWYKAKHKFVKHEFSMRGGFTETCALSYPECKFWDPMDCLGYLPLVAKEKKLVMMPTMSQEEAEQDDHAGFEKPRNWSKHAQVIQSGAYRPLQYPKYGGR